MRLLTSEKKYLFLDRLMQLRQQLNAFKPKNTLQSLELFENQLTLNEMEACFFGSESDEMNTHLIHLLSSRWERVRCSNMCYTQQPYNLVNQLCFEIAKEIAPPASTASEIEALEPNTGPYCLLMPSLEKTEDVYGNNIHSLGLHEFVLSDNERVFIPLAQCLHQASVSDEGRLRQTVAIDGEYPELTPTEIERVSHHSKQAEEFYRSIIALNKQRLFAADNIGAQLSQLAKALRGGGARGSGSEFNAGSKANLGILAFSEYWQALSDRQKSAVLTEEPELKGILGRLFRPDDVNYKETRFCVEILANSLDPIIWRYNEKPTIQTLHEHVLKQENAFRTAAENHHGLAIIPKEVAPKHILHRIFKLNIEDQKVLFKQQGYENALMYALAHEPVALLEFELDEKDKQQAVLAKIKPNNDSGLIVASKLGSINAIKLLLSWGSDIRSHDMNGSDALNWAATKGHVDAVSCLLENGALLEARGFWGNTALNWAVYHEKKATVELLLKKNADINARNNKRMNALDIAIKEHSKLVEPILMHLATFPADQQAECLLNVPGGPYPNVFFYAASHKPSLFNALMTTVLAQPDITPSNALFTTPNQSGVTPLMLAAQLGANESINKLIELGLDIQSHDTNGSDALNWAVYYGKKATVELLLKKNADINARNNQGMNALDIAIKRHSELVEPILMHLATLPADQQVECLLNVPGGPYDDIYAYVAVERPEFFNSLLKKSNASTADITDILAKMHFDEHIKQISKHYQLMKKKSSSNSNYTDAALAAKTLLTECGKATVALFQSNAATDVKISLFKNTCKSAIKTAKPVLKKYREWAKVLTAFLLAIITLPVSLPLYTTGLFSAKTKSEQLIDKLYESVDRLNL